METFAIEDLDTKFNLRPTNDKIVVRRAERKQTKSGLTLPDNMRGDNVSEGEVIAVGPGGPVQGTLGDRYKMQVNVGDKVLFNRRSGTEIEVNGEKVIVMHEGEIMVVLVPKKS